MDIYSKVFFYSSCKMKMIIFSKGFPAYGADKFLKQI